MTAGTAYTIAFAIAMPTTLRNSLLGKNATDILAAVKLQFNLSDPDAQQLDTTQLVDEDGFLDTSPRAVARFIATPTGYTGTACPGGGELSKIGAALQNVQFP